MSDRYETPRGTRARGVRERRRADGAAERASRPKSRSRRGERERARGLASSTDRSPRTRAVERRRPRAERRATRSVEVPPPSATRRLDADAEVEPEEVRRTGAGSRIDVADDDCEHAPGELTVPPGYAVLEGEPDGERRAVGIVVARFNGDVTTHLLESALEELEALGVARTRSP